MNDELLKKDEDEEIKEEEVMEETEGVTPSPEVNEDEEESVEVEEETETEIEPEPEVEKMLPQSKVNELIGQARREGREAAIREYESQMFGKYGVANENELNDIFGKGQAYESLNDDYATQSNSLRDVMAENALLKSRVKEDKHEDIKLILAGKGLEVTVENIEQLLPTHPEWLPNGGGVSSNDVGGDMGLTASGEVPQGIKPATLGKLGSEISIENNSEDLEKETARKLLGF